MRKPTRVLKKIAVSVTAIPLLIVGIILVPLPGPGLLICFIALTILSLEFEFAREPLDKIRKKFGAIYKKAKARADKIESLGDKKK